MVLVSKAHAPSRSSVARKRQSVVPVYALMFLILASLDDQCFKSMAIAVQGKGLLHNPLTRARRKLTSLHSDDVSLASKSRLKASKTTNGSVEQVQTHASTKKQLVSLSLAISYFCVMGAKCALPSVLPLLMSPTIGLTFQSWASSPQAVFAQILTIATLSVALGKVLLGPIIDYYGGTASMKTALLVLFLLLGTISFTSSFWVFTVCWILIDFCFSSCWAACINAIHQNFEPALWGPQVGRLAMAARAGNSMAFALFASILHRFQHIGMKQYWRPVFLSASIIQLVPLILLSVTARPERSSTASSSRRPSVKQSLSTLQNEVQKVDFWLHLTSRSVLMIFASFLLFVPTLAISVFGLSSAEGAQAASLYALGCLLSVSSFSTLFSKSTKRQRLVALAALLLGGATSSSVAFLGHVSSWWAIRPSQAMVLLFVWGFSFAIPFYIPPSLYALSRGGEVCSATITDAFDAIGFCLLAAFNGYVAGLSHNTVSSWIPTFFVTTACSLISFVSMMAVTARETTDTAVDKNGSNL